MSNYETIKKAKDSAKKALDALLAKYAADADTVDCTKMDEVDYQIYIAIDDSIERMKEAMNNLLQASRDTGENLL